MYVNNGPTRLSDPSGLLATGLLLRAASRVLGTGATAEEIAVQARLLDSLIGGVSAITGHEMSEPLKSTEIPVVGVTVGTASEVVSGYGGVRTGMFALTIANASGIAGASVTTVVGSATLLGGMSLLGGWELGRAIDRLLLDRLPGGNPVENAFCATLFECALRQSSEAGQCDRKR